MSRTPRVGSAAPTGPGGADASSGRETAGDAGVPGRQETTEHRPERTERTAHAERASHAERSTRAQITTDYAVGAGIFLLAVAFAVSFSGQLFVPFGDEAGSPTADRLADELAGGLLGDPADPAVLDPVCTAAFFETFRNDTAPPAACAFGAADSPAAALGTADRVDVSIEGRPRDAGAVRLDTSAFPEITPDSVRLSTPASPHAGADATTARRVVFLDGRSVRLVVRVW
ncbi:DUF7287 family protein [Candidatus Halobonum tyrrellensis]|uniref:Uncharacterized protein n=1 Tax=Candidatus Halobonum tyrrellensis G22 TaxID=1324957 RepID=V4J2J3_9EURY|nr:hypothetical protein [Candidatus Halobonum tyrrellensis]ESP89627.1 hypothetical protein K933_02881 [Candidatus Halobonum tyrrellensis G22]